MIMIRDPSIGKVYVIKLNYLMHKNVLQKPFVRVYRKGKCVQNIALKLNVLLLSLVFLDTFNGGIKMLLDNSKLSRYLNESDRRSR